MTTFTIKLQSPAYNGPTGALGEEIPLPISDDTYQGTSLAEILTLFNGNNQVMDFRQLREVIQVVGFLTPAAAVDAGFINPVDQRDVIRRVRSVWPGEVGTTAGANWGTATLPAAEQDATTTRFTGRTRLIFEKQMAGRQITQVSITGGTATLTAATNQFLSSDVGKSVIVPGAGAAGAALETTISAYTSGTQVTLAANAGTTVSTVRARVGSLVNFFMYGTVGDFRFGPRTAASGRIRIPVAITFLAGSVKVGV